MLEDMVRGVEQQGSDLTVMVDGTYRVSSRGWTLANIGIMSTYWNTVTSKYQKTFVMIACCFMQSESIDLYNEFASALSNKFYELTGINFVPTFSIADHSDAVAGGLELAWPGLRVLTCWPHLVRNFWRRLKGKDPELQKKLMAHIYFLHALPTQAAFDKLKDPIMAYWRNNMNEGALADWFESTYLERERWSGWFNGASGVAGVVANNNALESAQRVQKTTETSKSRNALNERVFTHTILSILRHAKLHDNLRLVAHGPIPGSLVSKAIVMWTCTAAGKKCVIAC